MNAHIRWPTQRRVVREELNANRRRKPSSMDPGLGCLPLVLILSAVVIENIAHVISPATLGSWLIFREEGCAVGNVPATFDKVLLHCALTCVQAKAFAEQHEEWKHEEDDPSFSFSSYCHGKRPVT